MRNEDCKTHWFMPHSFWTTDILHPLKEIIVLKYECIECQASLLEELVDISGMSYSEVQIIANQAKLEGFRDDRVPF